MARRYTIRLAISVAATACGAAMGAVASPHSFVPAAAAEPFGVLDARLACVSRSGLGCAYARGLTEPSSVALTADGLSAYATAAGGDAVLSFKRDPTTGKLAQLSGAGGCAVQERSGPLGTRVCATGRGLDGAAAVVASADGRNVYVAATEAGTIATFARDPSTGALFQLEDQSGCLSDDGSGGSCGVARGLAGASSIAISDDGMNIYVGSLRTGMVAVLRRDADTGLLVQDPGPSGCVSDDGSGGACVDGRSLAGASSVTVSPDGRNVYVTSAEGDAVAVLSRDPTTGALAPPLGSGACVSESGAAGCTAAKALDEASSVAVSPDGRHVYAASAESRAIAAFARASDTGALEQLAGERGCVAESGAGGCARGRGIGRAHSLALSPDGLNVYVVSGINRYDGALAVLSRESSSGALSQPPEAACFRQTGSDVREVGCAPVSLGLPGAPIMADDGRNLYLPGKDASALNWFKRKTVAGPEVDISIRRRLRGVVPPHRVLYPLQPYARLRLVLECASSAAEACSGILNLTTTRRYGGQLGQSLKTYSVAAGARRSFRMGLGLSGLRPGRWPRRLGVRVSTTARDVTGNFDSTGVSAILIVPQVLRRTPAGRNPQRRSR